MRVAVGHHVSRVQIVAALANEHGHVVACDFIGFVRAFDRHERQLPFEFNELETLGNIEPEFVAAIAAAVAFAVLAFASVA